jgi:phosphoribosylformylglycinamidine synthase
MVGLIDDIAHVTRATFAAEGDAVVLLGECSDELGASEYLSRVHGVIAGAPPAVDLDHERRLVDALLDAIRAGDVRSAHDTSDGGLAVALAECCMAVRERPLGLDADLSAWSALPLRALLFGETQGRMVVSTANAAAVLRAAADHGVPARVIGRVTAAEAGFTLRTAHGEVASSVEALAAAYHDAIPSIMDGSAAAVAAAEESIHSRSVA